MTDIHKALLRVRTVFCMLLLISGPAFAESSAYRVEGVKVDVTADNAVEAREKAFEEAQMKAFDILAERILSEGELEAYQKPDIATISNFVQDFEVTNEQLSAVRYKGTYTFRFRSGAIQGHLAQNEFEYSDTPQTSPVLILPFSQMGTRTVLWEGNPFMEAWAKLSRQPNGEASTMVPMGDLLDVSQVKDDPALRYDKTMIDNMVARYDAQKAVILIADMQADQSLDVSMYSTDNAMPAFIDTIKIESKPGMPEYTLYEDAVREVQAALRHNWKAKTKIDPGQMASIKARARFSSVQEWIQLKRSIEAVSGVNSVKVQGLKPREAVIRIEYTGGEARLIPAFSQAGILLNSPYQGNPYNAQIPGEAIYDISLANKGRY